MKASSQRVILISLFGEIYNLNSRVYKIFKAFGANTTFITPDFNHAEKKYKGKVRNEINPLINSVYLPVPKYSKNLSIKRLFSHIVFAFKLSIYLRNLKERPLMVICLMPTSSAAFVAGRYCKKKSIFYVVDVIDAWPDSLVPLTKHTRLINLLVFLWKYLTKKAYRLADYISGESRTYAYSAHKINPNVPWSFTYLGVDISETKKLIENSKLILSFSQKEIKLCYGGSLGNSYDFENILQALKFIQDKGIKYKMYFVGDGEKRNEIEQFAKHHRLKIEVTGRLDYADYLYYLSRCDIGFNSFVNETKVVHSYKFNDYCACRLFVFNNLTGETSEMIEKYDIGINYNHFDLSKKLLDVCENWNYYNQKIKNIDALINNELDSQVIYKKMKDSILDAYKEFSKHV